MQWPSLTLQKVRQTELNNDIKSQEKAGSEFCVGEYYLLVAQMHVQLLFMVRSHARTAAADMMSLEAWSRAHLLPRMQDDARYSRRLPRSTARFQRSRSTSFSEWSVLKRIFSTFVGAC